MKSHCLDHHRCLYITNIMTLPPPALHLFEVTRMWGQFLAIDVAFCVLLEKIQQKYRSNILAQVNRFQLLVIISFSLDYIILFKILFVHNAPSLRVVSLVFHLYGFILFFNWQNLKEKKFSLSINKRLFPLLNFQKFQKFQSF